VHSSSISIAAGLGLLRRELGVGEMPSTIWLADRVDRVERGHRLLQIIDICPAQAGARRERPRQFAASNRIASPSTVGGLANSP